MIANIIVGAGTTRKVIALVRDRDQRVSLASAIKAHLFPTRADHDHALQAGNRRAAQYRRNKVAAA